MSDICLHLGYMKHFSTSLVGASINQKDTSFESSHLQNKFFNPLRQPFLPTTASTGTCLAALGITSPCACGCFTRANCAWWVRKTGFKRSSVGAEKHPQLVQETMPELRVDEKKTTKYYKNIYNTSQHTTHCMESGPFIIVTQLCFSGHFVS